VAKTTANKSQNHKLKDMEEAVDLLLHKKEAGPTAAISIIDADEALKTQNQ
jgi:hypothetical protein